MTAKHTDKTAQREQFQPVAALLALLLPGAGHAYIGETKRAIGIAVGVLGLFFGGLFIGGIDTVDRREDFVWYLGEALVGPIAWGTDFLHQTRFKGVPEESLSVLRNQLDAAVDRGKPGDAGALVGKSRRSADPDETIERQQLTFKGGSLDLNVLVPAASGSGPPNRKSLGRVNELGTLYATIAGMLNLICIIDAAFRPSRRRTRA